MRNAIKKFFQPVREFVQYLILPEYLRFQDITPPYKTNLVLLYEEKLMESSVDYAVKNFRHCLYFKFAPDVWNYTIGKIAGVSNEKLYLEFGVWVGSSINHFSSALPDKTFYGFDSFEGLKEDWTGFSLAKGHFSLGGKLPKVQPNVKLVKGWFDDTLPNFLKEKTGEVAFIHIDCDTYESTKFVLNELRPRIVPGTYILFDEYTGYPNWELGEYKAFQEFVTDFGLKYKYIAFSFKQVLLMIE